MLEAALGQIDGFVDSKVLVDYRTSDDAGVYLLDSETALVQTVDFFTPIVDDPFLYGQIAAANSLSDIYAMGGAPRFALSIVAFPKEGLDTDILSEIMRGGTSKLKEARVALLGGHSVQDPEIKFGYCVTGMAHPGRILTNAGARAGDRLLLTKAIGTGIIATGIKFRKCPPSVLEAAVKSMSHLNEAASHCLRDFAVHAATDVTGFGLLGHAFEIARASSVTLRIDPERVPVLPGTKELASKGMLPGGIESNRRYVDRSVRWEGARREAQQLLLDPQTSGGLLISVAAPDEGRLIATLEENGERGILIGEAIEKRGHLIEFGRIS